MHDLTRPHFEDRNRKAEIDALNARTDRDRIIASALQALEDVGRKNALMSAELSNVNAYLCGYTGVLHTGDVLSLIDDIRRSLSPLVR